MRRTPRLQGRCGLSSRTAKTTTSLRLRSLPPAAATRITSRRRSLSNTRPTLSQTGRYGTSWPTSEPNVPTPPPHLQPSKSSETAARPSPSEAANAKDMASYQSPQDPDSLPLPPLQRTTAVRPKEVSDPSYTPETSTMGLPEVRSTDDWFADDKNWDDASRFVGFAPAAAEKLRDPAVLEVMVRRAVAEALVMRGKGRDMAGLWEIGGRDQLMRALECGIVVCSSEDEAGRIAKIEGGDVEMVAKDLDDVDEPAEDDYGDEVPDERPGDIETGRRQSLSSMSTQEQEIWPFVTPQEAAEMCKAWGRGWKDMSLDDVGVKFAIIKRVYQLTGHRIHDYKVHYIENVKDFIKAVKRQSKPAPVKMYDVLSKEAPELFSTEFLPNVKVYDRRITPIDKEKMVGRWKVIERELIERDLPVTGHRHLPEANLRNWVVGKP